MERVETAIARVTVYRNGALVVRVGRGEGEVEVAGLPLTLASESVRVRPAAGRVSGLREACTLEVSGPVEDTSAHQREADRLALEVQRLDAETSSVQRRMTALEALLPAPPGGRDPHDLPDATKLVALHAAGTTRLTALAERMNDLRKARKEAARAAERHRQVVNADPEPPRFSRAVRFALSEAAEFELEYFVSAARWVPDYTLDLRDGRARLRLDALVAQASGEDWSDAEVRVATADLKRATRAPALKSWRIGLSAPAEPPKWRALPPGLDALFAGYDRAAAMAPRPPPPDAEPPPEMERAMAAGPPPAARPAPARKRRIRSQTTGTSGAAPPPPPPQAPAPSAPPMRAAMAPPPPAGAPSPDLAAQAIGGPELPTMARSRGGLTAMFGGGGGGGSGGGPPVDQAQGQVRPPDGEPEGFERLAHAWMRLAGPDEPGRGKLHAVDPLTHLWSLLDGREVTDRATLGRAIRALVHASARLASAPTPQGTRALAADGFHHVFSAAGRHAIPGDGEWHRVTAHHTEAPARTEYRAVPRRSGEVFRFCEVEAGGGPLPAGPMHVHIDGVFRVTAMLRGSGGGEPLELNLGVAPAVRVVDRVARVTQESRGLMSSTTRVEHEVSLRVRNGLETPITMVLFDRLPVPDPEVDDVEVELVESDPRAERTDEGPLSETLEGGLRWRFEVPASSSREVRHTYRVELPSKLELEGGNRRE